MRNFTLLDVVTRAADDREFRAALAVDPDSIARMYDLGREEQAVIHGISRFSLTPDRALDFDADEFCDLLSLLLKLAVEDPARRPNTQGRLLEVADHLKDVALEKELAERAANIKAIATAKEKAQACEEALKALQYVILLVMAIVLLVRLLAEPDDHHD